MAFVQFMASKWGRISRIAVGIVLIILGVFVVQAGTGAAALIIVGLVPLLAGLFDVCLVAPLFGAPFKGADVRARK